MMERLLNLSITHRAFVILGAVALVILGAWAWPRVTLDAVPDITTNQVVVNTETGGLGPEEVETLITFPVESSLAGLTGVKHIRSLSQYGLSQVVATFDDSVDIYFARQLVSERLSAVVSELPAGTPAPQMGPVSTGLGDIYMYALESETRSVEELRELQDWVIAPQLRTVQGIAEVNAADGRKKQFHVVLDLPALYARGLSVHDVAEALQSGSTNVGGGLIEEGGRRATIRSVGVATSEKDLAEIVLKESGGIPVLIGDVAEVRVGTPILTGFSTKDGRDALGVIVMMLRGANGRDIAKAIDQEIESIRGQLPEDVTLTTVYDRAEFVDEVLETVKENLLEGAALVIVVLLLLLGNIRGALIAASAIPMAMLIAIIGMERLHISGDLLSLGAIDFGIIVDGAVIMVENCVRRLSQKREELGRALTKGEHDSVIRKATAEVRRVTQFGEMIIIATFIPILALEGTEGKMFGPMALVFILALTGALVLSLTLVPALCRVLLKRDTREARNPIMSFFSRLYRPIIGFALKARFAVIAGAALLVAGALIVASRLGSEFVPQLDEGSLVIQPIRPRTADMETSARLVKAFEQAALRVPEVETVFSRTGTPEVATDPMPISLTDSFLMLKPRHEWREGMTKQKLIDELEHVINEVPGQGYAFSQPIQLRFAELVSGVKADIGVKVFGSDLQEIRRVAGEVAAALREIPGAEDVEVEQVDAVPVLQIEPNREELARLGMSIGDVQEVVALAMGRLPIATVLQGERRFDVAMRLPVTLQNDAEAISGIRIAKPGGGAVPLRTVADIRMTEALAQISRENSRRRVVVQLNVRGRDLRGFVQEAQAVVSERVALPEGSNLEWGGQFENLRRASARLGIVVPLALALIFILLYATFRSMGQALLIFAGVPFAVTGGIVALALRGMPFSISAGVGFIALSGVAVLNGVVLISAINRLREQGVPLAEAVRRGSEERLRPVLMTALVAALGFIPMALNTGIGAEVQRPLATVVIGGILTAAGLTLIVLPALSTTFVKDQEV